MKKSIVLALALITLSFSAFSQDTTKTFTLSGSVDTYVRTALGTTNNFAGYGPSSSFADLKGFSLGMFNLIASYSGERSGFVGDIVFGPRGQAAVFGTASGQAVINQMYGYYKLSDKVTLNMGQFNTFLGYEVISPTINVNYSTSYLFSYGPFNHTGLRADFDFGDGLVGKLSIMNPTDIVEFNPVNTYTLGAQIGKTGDFGGVWLNFLYGDQDGTLDEDDFHLDEDGEFVTSAGSTFQVDLTAGFNISESFYLGVNTSLQQTATGEAFTAPGTIADVDGDASSFFGIAVYPKFTLSESFALGLRGEYFSVKNAHLDIFGLDAGDGDVIEFTVSGNWKVGGLTIIPELRLDKTSEDSFTDKDGEPTDQMLSATLAAVYKF
ncbi:outer membrane beta-barrel protein [Pseudochryseolinea flava]|uniref:Porin n=1 Tax=Pseudochryseolinea flava TaxID=2059302 RepID=A0A364Y233_9BACT|nr:outer membrane beta-barrel protein [Pseudochryseolinea flava]RAW00700.1 porin [Pseudochryseolinea flava]